jgi:hypothetical protein
LFWVSREVRLWHMLLAIWPTLLMATLVTVLNDIRRQRFPWPGTRNERTIVVLCTARAALMYLLPFASAYFFPQVFPENVESLTHLRDFHTKLLVLHLLGVGALTLHTSGIFGVQAQLLGRPWERSSRREKPEAASLREDVLRYQQLRSWLKRYLGFTATIASTTLLSLGALSIGGMGALLWARARGRWSSRRAARHALDGAGGPRGGPPVALQAYPLPCAGDRSPWAPPESASLSRASLPQRLLRWPPGRCLGWGQLGQVQVAKNAPDDAALGEVRQHPPPSSAPRTGEDVR